MYYLTYYNMTTRRTLKQLPGRRQYSRELGPRPRKGERKTEQSHVATHTHQKGVQDEERPCDRDEAREEGQYRLVPRHRTGQYRPHYEGVGSEASAARQREVRLSRQVVAHLADS